RPCRRRCRPPPPKPKGGSMIAIIVLTVITSFSGDESGIGPVLLKILLFFVFAFAVYFLATKLFDWMISRAHGRNLHRYPLLAFVLCLLMAYSAEKFFGVSDIIGAFAAGLIIASTPKAKYIESKFEPISYLLLTPIFFANIGINAVLPSAGLNIVIFSFLLLAVAILSKLIGCGLGARLSGFRGRESVQVGIGMACRGEVALIVANKGVALGLISSTLMTPFIVTVIGCAVLTPIMLKIAFRNTCSLENEQSGLVDRYGSAAAADIASEHFLGSRSKSSNNTPPTTPPSDTEKAAGDN
ncbi:MAG: hypothetical protein EOM14_08995, partial [Clostridia bacterium]|nr:hypothetical protein [Clostridia bacterium]